MLVKDSDTWALDRWHGRPNDVHGSYSQWRLGDLGIYVQGEPEARRTKGEPITARRIADQFEVHIAHWSETFLISAPMLVGLIATESGGKPEAERHEPKLGDWSIGLTQTLTATAKGVLRSFPNQIPKVTAESIPAGGSLEIWRGYLRQPEVSIGLAAAYLRSLSDKSDLRDDPVLLYAAYNAGSARAAKPGANPWGIVSYGNALDHFTRWFGDACAVYGVCR